MGLQAKQKAFRVEESQAAADNHFADVAADYYAKKAQVAAAAEKVKLSL